MKSQLLAISTIFILPAVSCAGTVSLSNYQLWSTTNGNDTIRVIPVGVSVVADGCSDPDSYMVRASLTETSKSRIYSTLLAAKLAGKGVKINTSACEQNRPAIDNVILE